MSNSVVNMLQRGALIIIEGCDRTGKSTQAQKLVESLKLNGLRAKYQNFPDRNTSSGSLIDGYLKKTVDLPDECIHLLFSLNRWELKNSMENELMAGTTLIVDRYSFSGIAYSAAKGMDFEWCKNPEKGLLKPDLVVFLKANSDILNKRENFGTERYEKVEFQKKVEEVFDKLCQSEFCIKLDADKSIDEISKTLLNIVTEKIDEVKMKPLEKQWV